MMVDCAYTLTHNTNKFCAMTVRLLYMPRSGAAEGTSHLFT